MAASVGRRIPGIAGADGSDAGLFLESAQVSRPGLTTASTTRVSEMTDQKALIIGGTGQIGVAAAEELARHGWQVTVASRRAADPLPSWAELDIRTAALDRADTGALRAAAAENDPVVDVVAFTPGR